VAVYDVILLYGIAHTAVALGTLPAALARRGRTAWGEVADGVAEICCALLLRLWFDPPFRATLGAAAWALFAWAAVWAFIRWTRMLWGLAGEDEAPAGSLLGALGIGLSSGARQFAAIAWHVAFVAPSLVCGAMALLGIARR